MESKSYNVNDVTRFLLPLLGIPREYLIDNNFITSYTNGKQIILRYKSTNKYLDELNVHKEINGESICYFIDIQFQYLSTIGLFISGKYSKFPLAAKIKILDFWKAEKGGRLHSILYPTQFLYEQGYVKTLMLRDKEMWPIPDKSNYYTNSHELYSESTG